MGLNTWPPGRQAGRQTSVLATALPPLPPSDEPTLYWKTHVHLNVITLCKWWCFRCHCSDLKHPSMPLVWPVLGSKFSSMSLWVDSLYFNLQILLSSLLSLYTIVLIQHQLHLIENVSYITTYSKPQNHLAICFNSPCITCIAKKVGRLIWVQRKEFLSSSSTLPTGIDNPLPTFSSWICHLSVPSQKTSCNLPQYLLP